MRRIGFIVASLLVSALFLWLALQDVPLDEVIGSIRQADLLWVLLSMASIVLAFWVRAVRWRGLLDFRIPLGRAFFILSVSFLLNQLPLRVGEVARSLLATRSGVPVVTAATSILVERLLDTLMVVVMLTVALSRLPDAVPAAAQTAALFGAAAVIAFAIMVIFARYPQIAHRILDVLEGRIGLVKRLGLRHLIDHILEGLKPLTHWRSGVHAVVWTLISWATSLMTFYTLERALDVTGVDLALTSVLGVSLASFSIAIPVSVASIGPFEGAVRLAGEAVGMPAVLSTSLGFLFHGVTIITYAALGIVGLLALGVSLSDVMRAQPQPAREARDLKLKAKPQGR